MSLDAILPDFMMLPFLGQPTWMWVGFMTIIATIMLFDLGLLNRRDHAMGVKESLRLTLFYMLIAIAFGIWVYMHIGFTAMVNYYTAYVIEQSLSLDNIFVISVIMGYFAVPREYQHRVLFWGIIGVIVLRGLVIGFGTAIVHEFDWVLVLFALLLLYTGIKMLRGDDADPDLDNNSVIALIRRHINFTSNYHGRKFFVRLPDPRSGKRILFGTPLFLALVTVELADIVFAFDSLPAVLAITTDPFIVFTSNLFAIIGLRALYFALAAMLDRFQYLHYSLSFVLIFIGLKVLYHHAPEELHVLGEISPLTSLAITLTVLGGGVIYSLAQTRAKHKE